MKRGDQYEYHEPCFSCWSVVVLPWDSKLASNGVAGDVVCGTSVVAIETVTGTGRVLRSIEGSDPELSGALCIANSSQ